MRPRLFVLFFLALFCSCSKKEAPAATTPTPSTPVPATAADISSLNCSGSTISGSATVGIAYSGTVTMPYLGGNGLAYNAGSALTSSGVTGLTATLQAGTLASGSGSFTFSVTGTPSATGLATFSLAFGSRSCSVSIPVNEDPNFTQYGTPFTAVPNRQDAVIYQVNMRAFSAQSNFQGVIARLDSIKALGANVVYLMPIYPVGTVNSVNSPYSVRDYRAINTEFGTLTDLRALVDGAHSRNMSVMLDWVANHTAWDHPWISTHSDWYVKNSSGAIISPPGTGWNDVAQLDYTNSAMRLEMIRSLKYWVYTANVDGFRFDYADGPPATFWRQAIDTLRAISTHNLLLLAEGNRSDHFSSGFDLYVWLQLLREPQERLSRAAPPVTVLDARQHLRVQ
jgi:hypothetical protein